MIEHSEAASNTSPCQQVRQLVLVSVRQCVFMSSGSGVMTGGGLLNAGFFYLNQPNFEAAHFCD